MTWRLILAVAVVLLLAESAVADDSVAAARFDDAAALLARADEAREAGAADESLGLYKRALNVYARLSTEHPDWQPRIVLFRMEYCDKQVDSLLRVLRPAETSDDTLAEAVSVPTNIVAEARDMDAAPAVGAETNVTATPEAAPAAPPAPPAPAPDLEAILSRARQLIADTEPGEARVLLLEGFKVDPDNRELRLLAAVAQCQMRRFNDALFLLRELVDQDANDLTARIVLSAAYFGSGRHEEARRELAAVLARDPGNHDAHYNMAQLLLHAPSPDIATAAYHYGLARQLGAPPDSRIEAALE